MPQDDGVRRGASFVMGLFAKMFAERDRVETVAETEEGYEVVTRSARPSTSGVKNDSPPEHFVESIEDDGGTVYAIPFLEALRNVIRRKREPKS